LGQGASAAGLTILRRILAYGRKVLRWEQGLDAVQDSRRRPQISTSAVIRAMAVMFLSRLGSLNALEQSRSSRFWAGWSVAPFPSADSLGRVGALVHSAGLRSLLHDLYTRLKRTKALEPPPHGLMAAIVDGHESHATFRRCCAGCRERTIHTKEGDRLQYYHRYAALQVVSAELPVILDLEPQMPGEDEVATALRLLERALPAYPRAFDVIVADALYADPRMFNYVLSHGKDIIAVLKNNQPGLLEDARGLWGQMAPETAFCGGRSCTCWDIEGFTWPQVTRPVRIVRNVEKWSVRRQLDRQVEELSSEWAWVTTLSKAQASPRAVSQLGHGRWRIENQGFNELVNRWDADHVYKHQPNAMLTFWLMAMACLNLFLAFYRRDLKPAARQAASMLQIARAITAELLGSNHRGPARAPT
jgi:hypothetical protein